MLKIEKQGIILGPTENPFENESVLNPAIVQVGETIHMFYRATSTGNKSSIGYARLDGPLDIVERDTKPIISPTEDYEVHGVEDPRVVLFEGLYYMFYTAYDGYNAKIAYAVSKDLKNWEKKGIISPKIKYKFAANNYFKNSKIKADYYKFEEFYTYKGNIDLDIWDKDAFIFPERFDNKIALIHRILPDIQIAFADNLEDFQKEDYWTDYVSHLNEHILMEGTLSHESRSIGAGAPPIKTQAGWLLIYHSVKEVNNKKFYLACAALLDLNNPRIVIGKLQHPLFRASFPWEKGGVLGKTTEVVFPTGTAIFDDELYIYYGTADTHIAVGSVKIEELLHKLTSQSSKVNL